VVGSCLAWETPALNKKKKKQKKKEREIDLIGKITGEN
jgi:hypothetical protein